MDPIRFRCPKCRRLYSVLVEEIQGSKPQFQCLTCQSDFYFSYPPPAEAKEAPTFFVKEETLNQNAPSQPSKTATFPCPSCGFENPKGELDCKKCGIVFSKFVKRPAVQTNPPVPRAEIESGPPQIKSASLSLAWEEVSANYANRDIHERFIQRCFTENNLPFASQQYRKILDASPNEEIAKAMRDRIIMLTTLTYIPPTRPKEESGGWGFSIVLIVIGAMLLLTGFFSPELRSTSLIGLVLIAAGFGLKFLRAQS